MVCKKRPIDRLKGQAGHDMPENPQNYSHFSEIPNRLSQKGFREIHPEEYIHLSQVQIDEHFIKFAHDNRPFVKVQVLDIPLVGLLDSGANRSILGVGSAKLLDSCKLKILNANTDVTTASGQHLEVQGYVNLPISFNGITKIISTLVIPTLKRRLILGTDFWNAFGIVPQVCHTTVEEVENIDESLDLTEDQHEQLEQVKSLFKPTVEGILDSTNLIAHRIELTEEAKKQAPVRINPFPVSPKRQQQIDEELNNMLKAGLIERSYSDWALRLVPVDKPDGSVRLCLDARKLNDRTVRDSYPLPHADRILSRLGTCKFISTIDLSKAFLQVPLHPKSRKYTAFSVLGRGLFQFTRMPFGLVNSPATLSRLMDRVLGGSELEPNVFVYLDDIIVISDTFEEHLEQLREVARRLRTANLSINVTKSKFCVAEVPYLGYILSQHGLRPNPDRIEAIVNFERPNSLKALRRFLGMCNYYRRFISNYSAVVQPLTDLLKDKPKSVKWNESSEVAFVNIKELLITSPILTTPDFKRPFDIHCDASDVAIAGVLTQSYDGLDKPIAYFSQKLGTTQQRYCATEKEALAVLRSIDKFRCYIEGTKFTVYTDASALTYILRSSWKTSSRLCRWSIELQRYEMEIKHRKGVDNVVPDALSRAIEELQVVVKKVDWYSEMLKHVSEEPEKYKDFKVDNGVLQKFVASSHDQLDYGFEWKTCVPTDLRPKILKAEHDDSLHPGFEKSMAKIRKKYYWPQMNRDVRLHIQKCSMCKESKPANRAQYPEPGQPRITTKPFQIIALDFIQSLPRSKQGNCHLLVIVDLFSKFCLLFPVRKISTHQVCKILEENWFRRYSTPEYLISDNASSFLSKEFKSLLERYHIQHWTNSRHHSQSNPTERLNRTINACMRTYVRSDQTLWDTRVSEIEYVLNNTPHSATGFTPYKTLFGHEIVETGDQHRIDRDSREVSEEERLKKKTDIDKFIYDLVKNNLKKQNEKNNKIYNLRHPKTAPVFTAGQKVFRRNFRQSSAIDKYNAKLGPLYVPCTVISRVGTSSYELADDSGKSIGVFSAADLKSS